MRIFGIILLSGLMICPALEAKEAKKKSEGGSRERVITREGRAKSGAKTKIDFGDTEIGGATKTPYGSMLTNSKANKNFDFVPIRTDWRPEMLQSASSLDAGRTR
jgi:hypothetical protein